MPEGDTVHKIAAYLRPRLVGTRPGRVIVRGLSARRLDGLSIEAIRAHGKHLFVLFEDGTLLRSHLGMSGSWHRYPSDRPWKRSPSRASIVIEVAGTTFVCFDAEEAELLRSGGVRNRELMRRLGPDLIDSALDDALPAVLLRARALLDPRAPAVDLLLDQRVAAGIGNIYKSEVLFLHGIHPATRWGAIAEEEVTRLYATAADLLRANTANGPRVTRRTPAGAAGLWVYHRRGLPCFRCGAAIRYATMGRGHRATYWCPGCQPELRINEEESNA